MCCMVEPAMPWRSKQRSAASTMAARVFAASSLVLRMAPREGVERVYIRSGTYVYYPPFARPSTMTFRFLLAAVVSALLVSGCGRKDAAGAQAAPPPMAVTVVKVAQTRVPVSVEAVGQ